MSLPSLRLCLLWTFLPLRMLPFRICLMILCLPRLMVRTWIRRYPARTHRAPDRYGWLVTQSFTPQFQCFLSTIQTHREPQSYREAIQSPAWQAVMEEELRALQATHTCFFPFLLGRFPLAVGGSINSRLVFMDPCRGAPQSSSCSSRVHSGV